MTYLLVVIALFAFAAAELPPSNSYLPPSPGRNAGYPQGPQPGPAFPGAPQVIAARNLDQGGQHGNGYSRSSSHERDHGRAGIGANQGYDDSAAAFGRNAIEVNSEPANYNFEYMVSDFNEGTDFGHQEERLEERAQGQYHVVLPDGRKQTVSYEADERGFKPQVSYQDSEDLSRSIGYDSNANTRAHGNGYDANAGTRNYGNGYDANAGTRSHGYKNSGHSEEPRGY